MNSAEEYPTEQVNTPSDNIRRLWEEVGSAAAAADLMSISESHVKNMVSTGWCKAVYDMAAQFILEQKGTKGGRPVQDLFIIRPKDSAQAELLRNMLKQMRLRFSEVN